MKQLLPLATLLVLAATRPARAQSPRLNDFNSLAWLVYVGDHTLP